MEKFFALFDSDPFYASRFIDYLKKKQEFDFEIMAFTKQESLEEFLSLHRLEILLFCSPLNEEKLAMDRVRYVYELTELTKEVNEKGYPCVYKFQPVQAVIQDIITDYNRKENTAQEVHHMKPVKIISVYPPLAKAEAAAFTWSLGFLLSDNKKVFLVNLELLPIPLITIIDKPKTYLTEFIYYLKEDSNIAERMNGLLDYQGNLAYLSGISHSADILSLTSEDVLRWIKEIKAHMDFPIVLFYIGSFTEATAELIKLSDTVLVADTGTAYENALFETWTQQMERSKIHISTDKFIRVQLKEERDLGWAPLTLSELRESSAWNQAEKYVNKL